MTQALAGHLLVECLIEQGITHAFGVPGESYLAVLDGFHAHRDKIRFVINRQEGGAAYMADAQARVTGRPGVCFVTRGPGATNASIGIHTAFQDSTPLVLFVGDVGSDCRDREAFQELDYNTFFGPNTKGMAKRVERIDDPEGDDGHAGVVDHRGERDEGQRRAKAREATHQACQRRRDGDAHEQGPSDGDSQHPRAHQDDANLVTRKHSCLHARTVANHFGQRPDLVGHGADVEYRGLVGVGHRSQRHG